MNYGKVEERSSSRSRSPSTARRAATSAILTDILSRSDRAQTSHTVNARPGSSGFWKPPGSQITRPCRALFETHKWFACSKGSHRTLTNNPRNPPPIPAAPTALWWPESHSHNDSSSRKSSRVTPRTALPSNRSELMTSSFSREKVLINQSNSNGEA